MSIEKVHSIPVKDDKLMVNQDTYFCYDCNAKHEVFLDDSPLRPCKCGCRIFYTI